MATVRVNMVTLGHECVLQTLMNIYTPQPGPTQNPALLSTEPAGRREIRLALAAMLVSALVFAAAIPFAGTPLAPLPAFIPAYVSALVLCDLITCALLFGQFSVQRSVALLVLAGAYLFSGCATLAYALTFPGLLPLSGLLGAGPQTSSAMYMFWHAGFPLIVIAHALIKDGPCADGSVGLAIAATVASVLAVVVVFSLFATWGHDALPVFIEGNRTTRLGHAFLDGVWLLSFAALIVRWRKKQHSVLDVWLLVVLGVWLFDIALSAIFNSGRYDLGWYVGRMYGLLAASMLLVALLVEYARLMRMSAELGKANIALAELSRYDGLTDLANRRFFDEYLGEQIAVARRFKRPLALVLCDVDHFKAYNDRHGHPAGDGCLQRVGAALKGCCHRPADMAARYGGEEFALVLPDTDLAGARRIAETARQAVVRMAVSHGASSAGPDVSVSCGVAAMPLDESMSAQQLIAAADVCLYEAKRQGRNRVASGNS
jgi:diguanylate cyclase (GGDEF)-like protein